MDRSERESQLGSRAARARLPVGTHWRDLDPQVRLGYRKGKRGGRWFVRWYAGDKRYRQMPLGTADDVLLEGTLSFDAAIKASKEAVCTLRNQGD